jgi:hypothetical protein
MPVTSGHDPANPGRDVMSMNALKAITVVAAFAWMGVDPVVVRAAAPAEDKKKAEDKANQVEGTLAAVDVTGNKVRIISVSKDPNNGQRADYSGG